MRSLLVVARREPQEKRDLELGALVQSRIELMKRARRAARDRGAPEGDARVVTDADAVSRVVDNLLRNAIDASPDGGEIRVRIRAGVGDDAHVELVVEDQGPGVAPDREQADLRAVLHHQAGRAPASGSGSRAPSSRRTAARSSTRATATRTRFLVTLPAA